MALPADLNAGAALDSADTPSAADLTDAAHITDPAHITTRGADLTDEETAALIAVLGRLAQYAGEDSDAGGTGPADRTLQRRHRLHMNQHGLWGRPGPASWMTAGGVL